MRAAYHYHRRRQKAVLSLTKRKNIHEAAIPSVDNSDVCSANTLINMYAKCGRLEDARKLFEGMQNPTVVSWSSLLMGYADNGESEKALDLFSRRGCPPSPSNFLAALKACSDLALAARPHAKGGCRERGKALHLVASSNGCDRDTYVGNTLIDLYGKCESMDNARKVFDAMPNRTSVSWDNLILGFASNGESEMALLLLWRMEGEGTTLTSRSTVAGLKACTDIAMKEKVPSMDRGRALHLLALSTGCASNMFVESALVDMWAKCGWMEDALKVFDSMSCRDAVTWTTLIFGYAANGEAETALLVFSRMRKEGCAPSSRSFVASLKACTELGHENGNRGKALHLLCSRIGRDGDMFVGNTLVDMYSNCNNMVDARKVFNRIKHPDIVSWNALLMGYAENGDGETALELFLSMGKQGCAPDGATFIAVSKACSDVAVNEEHDYKLVKVVSWQRGKAVHLLISMSGWETDTYVENTLLDMYAKCGSMEDARRIFDKMKSHDVISWNSLIFGYTKNEEAYLVLKLYSSMKDEGCEPDSCTMLAALMACGKLGALEAGKAIHGEVCSRGYENDVAVSNSLVDFYAKCGSLIEARQVFESLASKDLVAWSSLMAGYSRHGDTKAVFDLFEMMQNLTSLQPDCITFSCILAACSHAGLVDEGKHYFGVMSSKYGIKPDGDHYTSMTDILGRANKLDEAMVFLRNMPFNISGVSWMSVLGACKKWKNVELGRISFQSLISFDDKNVCVYALMGSIYGSRGMWEEQAKVNAIRNKLKGLKKPGQSWWTNREGLVHKFMVSDTSHPQNQEIYDKLKEIVTRMREHGYVADVSSITRDIPDEEKEDALCGHSERLAIACALINTSPGETIRVMKNLRVCDDCHATTALISKLEHRTIICRDATRFHVFKDGKCSCKDFW